MQSQQFKEKFSTLRKSLQFYTEDCEIVTYIDTETNSIEFTKSILSSCGCCAEYEQFDDELDRFIDGLSESDFQELMTQIESMP